MLLFIMTLGACYILNCNSFIKTVKYNPIYNNHQPLPFSSNQHKSSSIYIKSLRKANINMALGVDCNVYPTLADFLYGATKLEHCSSDILFSKSGNEFDLFGDLSLIICLIALNYVSSRRLVSSSDFIDIGTSNGEEINSNTSNNIINKSDLICPQCKGKGVFMNNTCELCDGMHILYAYIYRYNFVNSYTLSTNTYLMNTMIGTGLIEYNYEQNTKSLPSINSSTLWDDDEI